MHDLSYSDDALNVRSAFFGAKAIIYVEGDDDVLFWQEIFSNVTTEHFEVEAVGGAPALDEHIAKISSGQLEAIAARDADFLPLLGALPTNPRVVCTFGYSIENSLYTVTTLTQLVRLWCKSPRITVADCEGWLNQFASTVESLIHLDAANAISATGIATIGDNCSRYMTSDRSDQVCQQKVAAAVNAIAAGIPAHAVATATACIGAGTNNVLKHLRGHFLASAVHRHIVKSAKAIGKKVNISSESLYAAAIAQFSSELRIDHPHRSHYLDSARAAWHTM